MLLLATGLSNAALDRSEKGFLAISYLLGLFAVFAVIAVQKNVRDLAAVPGPVAKPDPAWTTPPWLHLAHLEKRAAIPTLLLS